MRTRDHLLALSLFFSTQASSAGIPVFDAVQNTESINQWMQKLQQWEDTVTHYKMNLMHIRSNWLPQPACGIFRVFSVMPEA